MATIQIINVSTPNDGLGDTLRDSQIKSNNNSAELNDKKVEKVAGKDLSSNDYTDLEQTKLAGIEDGAEVNIQSDWNQEDPDEDDYIKNKPPFLEANAFSNNMETSTGLYEFGSGGIVGASSTTFNVGNVLGYIIDDSDVNDIVPILVNYPGATGLSTPYLLTAPATYVLVDDTASLVLQNTRPTVTQRRHNIYLGVIGHPAGTITGIGNSPDVKLNTMSQVREMFEPTRLINEGVHPYAHSTDLQLANTAGKLYGLGIGFIANGNDAPSVVDIAAGAPMTTQYRTQGIATFANTTLCDPGFYDLTGTRTAIAGSSNQATNQRFYLLQNGMIRIQYGQTIYATLTAAIQAVQVESFVTNVNASNLGILVGILSVTKGCTDLSNSTTAAFLSVSKFGETVGAAGGISTATLQSAYNNSVDPEIVTNSTLDGFTVRRGSASDTDNIIVGQNAAGTSTFAVTGQGNVTMNNLSALITSNNQVGTTYTVVAADNGKQVILSNASAVTVTIPSGLPTGFNCKFYQQGTGKVSFTTSGGTVLRYQTYELPQTEEQYSIVGMENVTNLSGVYKLYGQLQSI